MWQMGVANASAVQAPPVSISETAGSPPAYTRVTCTGELLHERSAFVGPRPRSSMGQARPGCAQGRQYL